jgi:hypothetical protein
LGDVGVAVAEQVGRSLGVGRPWPRAARIHPPINAPKRTVSARYLFEDERITIADQHRAASSIRAIAALLDQARSTISREINRNRDPPPSGRDSAGSSQKTVHPIARPSRLIGYPLLSR